MLHFNWDTEGPQINLVDNTMNLYFPIQQEPEIIVNDTAYYPPQLINHKPRVINPQFSSKRSAA